MIRSNGFQFLNADKEHILDAEMEGNMVVITAYAGDEIENFYVTEDEALELSKALVDLLSLPIE